MTKVIPIGISGLARSGKTTAANYIDQYFTSNKSVFTTIQSFAGPIKAGLEIMNVVKEKNHDLYRYLGQLCGDGCRTMGDNDWWIDLIEDKIYYYQKNITDSEYCFFIIDDVRYINELKMVKEFGGINVFIDSGGRIDTKQKMYSHQSEDMAMKMNLFLKYSSAPKLTEIKFDYIIPNNGTVEEFEECVSSFLCYDLVEAKILENYE